MKVSSFEKPTVWQKPRALSVSVYNATMFPNDERFGLTSQMRRSAILIASNIAEGSGIHSAKGKARLTQIAFGPALKLLNQLIISNDLEFLSNENYDTIRLNI